MSTYKLKESKKCECCGKIHTVTSGEVKVMLGDLFAGIYWNCECGSTLFVQPKGVASVADELEVA